MLTEEQKRYIQQQYGVQPKTKQPTLDDAKISEEIAKLRMKAKEKEPKEKEGFLSKIGQGLTSGSGLQKATDILISPLARELERPFVSAVRGIQGLIPGGKTGKESVETPFGKVKPYSELSSGEAVAGAVETGLTVLPVEKVLAPIAKPVVKFFSGFAKRLGGTLSGKGVNVIEKIIENPQAAKIGLRKDEVDVLKQVANKARVGVKELSQKAGQEYEKAIDALPKVKQIDVDKLINKITDKFDDFGIALKNGELNFGTSPLDETQERVVNKMWNLIKLPRKYDDPKGLNNLARQVSKFRKTTDPELNNIVDSTRRAIRDVVSDEVPELRTALNKYSESQDFFDAIRTELSIDGAVNNTEGIIKTSKKLQNVFNSNKELTRDLLESFEGKVGKDILATEAGRQLGSAPSRAQVSIGDVARNIVQTVIPPKMVGEIAAATGIAKQKIKPFIDLLGTFAPAERLSIFNILRSAISDEEEMQ